MAVGEQVGKELRVPTESIAVLSPGPQAGWVGRKEDTGEFGEEGRGEDGHKGVTEHGATV